jgi:hypothetical protein
MQYHKHNLTIHTIEGINISFQFSLYSFQLSDYIDIKQSSEANIYGILNLYVTSCDVNDEDNKSISTMCCMIGIPSEMPKHVCLCIL